MKQNRMYRGDADGERWGSRDKKTDPRLGSVTAEPVSGATEIRLRAKEP